MARRTPPYGPRPWPNTGRPLAAITFPSSTFTFNNPKNKLIIMNSLILGLLADPAVHPGAGQSVGVIDLPVAREAATDYPVVVGSSLKGALATFVREQAESGSGTGVDFLFGKSDNAGALLVSDARLLLLPVRSLDSTYKWATCPHLLERWRRDIDRVGGIVSALPDLAPERGKFLGEANADDKPLFLEERQFAPTAGGGEAVA